MPAQTRGFSVQAQPGMNYLPASSLVGNLSGIIPAASQGAGFVSQLAQIATEAKLAPLRQQLQEIQVKEAQNRLDEAPVDHQIRLAQLAHTTQPLERVLGTDLKRIPRINSPEDSPALDEAGNPTFAEGDTNYDLTPVQRVEVRDPISGIISVQERHLTPIATAEQLGDRQDRLDLARIREESLASSRESNRALATERLNSPSWKRLGFGVNPNTGKQGYLIMNEKTHEIQEVPSDLIPIPTGADALTAKLDALVGGGKAAPANISVPGLGSAPAAAVVAPEDTPALPALDEEANGLIDGLVNQFKVSTPASAGPRAFNTVAAAQAAAASGQLKKGDKITVGGVPGTWQ